MSCFSSLSEEICWQQCFNESSLHFRDAFCTSTYKFSNNNSLCMVIRHEILSDNSFFLKICCLPSPFILGEKKCKEAVNIDPFNKSNKLYTVFHY